MPGSTILFPVVDCTRQYINALLTALSEPDGQRPVFIDDWQAFEPADVVEAAVWVGAQFGFPKKIPYQPIGGIKWVQNGFCNKDISAPLGMQRALRTDYESFFLLQNLMLVAQGDGARRVDSLVGVRAVGAAPRSGAGLERSRVPLRGHRQGLGAALAAAAGDPAQPGRHRRRARRDCVRRTSAR